MVSTQSQSRRFLVILAALALSLAVSFAAYDAAPVPRINVRWSESVPPPQREALALVDKARRAQVAGKTSTAKVYYRMAAKSAQGELRNRIVTEFERLADTPTAATARTSRGER